MNSVSSLPSGRIEIILDDPTRQLLYKMAKERNWRSDGRNPGADEINMDHVKLNYLGVLGEAAFALYKGLDLSEIQVYRGRGDDGIDFRIGNEGEDREEWQIKATEHIASPILYLTKKSKRNASHYGLVAYEKPRTLHLIGWARREELLATPLTPRWGTEIHMIPERDLRRFDPPEEIPEDLRPEAARSPQESRRAFISGDGSSEWKEISREILARIERSLPSEAEYPEWWESNLGRLLKRKG